MTIKEIGSTATPEESGRNQLGAGLADTLKPIVQQMLADEINEISLYEGRRKKVPIPNTEVVKLCLKLQESGVQKTVNLNITSRRFETKKEYMRQLGKRPKLGPRHKLDKYRISFLFNPDTNTLEYDKAFFHEDYVIIQPSKFKKGPPIHLESGWHEASSTIRPEEKILLIAIGALANLPDY